MARYDITHSCGHVVEHQLFGRWSDRESRIEWLSNRPCLDCWRENRDKARAEESAVAAEQNAERNLPSLKGSDRQIAWAETLRARTVTKIDDAAGKMLADPALTHLREFIEDAHVGLLLESDAKFWIDHREITGEHKLLIRVWESALALSPIEPSVGVTDGMINTARTNRALFCHQFAPGGMRADKVDQEHVSDCLECTNCRFWEGIHVGRSVAGGLDDAAQRARDLTAEMIAAADKKERMEKGKQQLIKGFQDFLGELVGEVSIGTWSGQQRCYFGHGYGRNCGTYYHTPSRYHAAGELELGRAAEERLGDRVEEFKSFLKAQCDFWATIKVDIPKT